MIESTDRPAWTSTLYQGMGNGLRAFKHRILQKSRGVVETAFLRDYDWTAGANAVRIELKKN